jgi:ABC-type Fe3+-siderophore transport system permease subunit
MTARTFLWPALPLVLLGALFVGSTNLPADAILRGLTGASDEAARQALRTVLDFRLPIILQAFFVGGLLSICGAALQAVLQNPLAEPYILGTSSGAAFGVSLAGAVGLSPFFWPRTLLSFVCALAASTLVIASGWRRGRGLSPLALILGGVVIGSFLSAATVAIQSILTPFEFRNTIGLLLGGFRVIPYDEILLTLIPACLAGLVLVLRAPVLDILSTGITPARSVGLSAGRELTIVVFLVTLVTALTVPLAGIIGFVGLVAPHLMRLGGRTRHARLLPAAFTAGGLITVLADAIAREASAFGQLPTGAVTAMLGAPIFILLLRRFGGLHDRL